MREEIRLVSIGWALSDAVTFCNTMRRDREDLESFVAEEEEAYRRAGENALFLL